MHDGMSLAEPTSVGRRAHGLRGTQNPSRLLNPGESAVGYPRCQAPSVAAGDRGPVIVDTCDERDDPFWDRLRPVFPVGFVAELVVKSHGSPPVRPPGRRYARQRPTCA